MNIIKNTFFILFNVVLISIVIAYFEDDISIESIKPGSNPDFMAGEYFERLPVYLASYADGHEVFYRNQNNLVKSSLGKGVDFYFNYRRSHIDSDFYKAHKNILDKKKGAGYWLWKPYFILKSLEKMPEGAILIYADCSVHFKNSVEPLTNLAKENDIILIEYEEDPYGTVRNIANKKILKDMGCEAEKCKNGPHLWAGFIVLKNTQKSRDFVQEWLNHCCNEETIFGLPGDEPEESEYRDHMEDQTTLSVLNAKNPNLAYRFAKDDLMELIIWHHRSPDKLNIPIKFINYIREAQRYQKKLF